MTTSITLPSKPREVGPALRKLRVRLGINQARLVAAGVGSPGSISALENAHKMPMLSTVLAYLDVLGCRLEIQRVDGSEIPEGWDRTRVVANAREPRQPRPESRPIGVPTCDSGQRTTTGRCLACFTIHDTP
jgi:transcriptional regulator with XRE-family HTH domain